MALETGSQLGAYEITGKIGAGGMGEVYRATDTRLGRDVAIKTLPASLTDDESRLARFEREARLLASLNHVHIASVFGLDEHAGTPYLAMELVEGDTLQDRLESGRLKLEAALQLAVQITEALEAAHDKGVVHRDLKPANVMVTPDGVVKVLDFGLAKPLTVDAGTLTADALPRAFSGNLTQEGAIQGTPAYMSPEQIRGEPVDARADIWAFGCMLYEMLSGQPTFAHGTLTETLARVLEREPDLDQLPPDTPAGIRRLIRRCLAKDPRRRLHHMADARIEIIDALTGVTDSAAGVGHAPHSSPLARAGYIGAGAVVASVSILAWLAVAGVAEGPAQPPVRFSIGPLPAANTETGPRVAVSADGSRIAYTLEGGTIYEGPIGEHDARAIARGEGLFYRDDGAWLGFSDGSALWKVPVAGGAAEEIAAFEPRFLGAVWVGDDIVFANNAGLYRVSADGGTPELLVRPESGEIYAWPGVIPGSAQILFTIVPQSDVASARVACLEPDSRVVTPVGRGTSAQYLSTGRLVYAAGGGLESVAFDPQSCRSSGAPMAIPDLAIEITGLYARAEFVASSTGTLATFTYISAGSEGGKTLVWVDPDTAEQQNAGISIGGESLAFPRISPDGSRVAVDEVVAGDRDIWVYDLDDGSRINVSASPGEDLWPAWSSDGERIYFGSGRSNAVAWSQIYSRRADGSGPTELLIDDPQVRMPWSVAESGEVLVFNGVRRRSDIGIVSAAEPREVTWRLASELFLEENASLSADGDFLLYNSTESGEQPEVYIRPYPEIDAARLQVSIAGGHQPRWGRESGGVREVYYLSPNGDMMIAEVDLASDPPSVEGRRQLFPNGGFARVEAGDFHWNYDVSPIDGRFLMVLLPDGDETPTAVVTVMLNWDEELNDLLAAD